MRGELGGEANPTARLAAVVALVAAAIVLVAVIAGSVGGSDSSTQASATTHSGGGAAPKHPYYVVQPGESLSVVAAKTGVELAQLIELNPNLDPQAIPASACVNLAPEGCKELSSGG
jgi:LysM repeat protein